MRVVLALVSGCGFWIRPSLGFRGNDFLSSFWNDRFIGSPTRCHPPYHQSQLHGTPKRKHGSTPARKTRVPNATVPHRVRALRQLSTEPLIFTIDDFLGPEACVALQEGNSEEARLQFASLVASELFAGQWGVNDGLRFNEASSADANNDGWSERSNCPEGLHVDTNNDSTFRSVTVILYLNDVAAQRGGATVFPLACADDDDPALGAARRLLADQIAHTRGAAGSTGVSPHHEADARLLENLVGDESRGLRIPPQQGRICIFFSRTADGAIDGRSWHGGERLIPEMDQVTEKRILTLFKEVHYGGLRPVAYETTFEAYIAPQIAKQRQALQDLAESHARFFVSNEN